jgi:hypothetical protein
MLGAMVSPGRYDERGLLHPFVDYDATPRWLNGPVDPMDDEGFVHISPEPGLGLNITWDDITMVWQPRSQRQRASARW